MKLLPRAMMGILLGTLLVGCNNTSSQSTGAISAAAPSAATMPSPGTPAAPAQASPYKQTTGIFQEFARLVEEQQQSPELGLEKCRAFVTAKAPELKALTATIRAIETGPNAANYLQEIMDSNEKIKVVTDKITELAQAKYGMKGADLMLILSDLTLARL